MTIKRADKSERAYKRVCMDYADDPRLSWEAAGVMSYLLSKSDDWRIVPQDIINRKRIGRDKAYRILDELQAAGYLTRTYRRDDRGRVQSVEYALNEVSPLPENTEVVPLPDQPYTENTEVAHDLHGIASPFPDLPYTANGTLPKVESNLRTREQHIAADAAPALSEQTDPAPTPAEVQQQPLQGLSGTPTPPVPAAPPPPRRPAKPRASKATPEQAAIRQALRAAAEWGPSGKANKQAADAGDALMLEDPGVTPERIATFAHRWFPRYSPIAAVKARNGERAERPTPEQVLRFWPSFVAWEAAQRAHDERQRETEPEPETPAPRRTREELDKLHPFRRGLASTPAPRPAMTAMGRRS